jgi:hypothetical protein
MSPEAVKEADRVKRDGESWACGFAYQNNLKFSGGMAPSTCLAKAEPRVQTPVPQIIYHWQ